MSIVTTGKRPLALIRDGIRQYNESQGNRTGYHEMITLAWIAVIVRLLAGRDRNRPFFVLADELVEECADKEYLARFYSRERLFSDEARGRWVFPDLAAIEQPEPAGGDAVVEKVNIEETLALLP